MKKSSKKFKNYTFLNILFFISSIFFIYALLLFNNVENIIRYLIISIVILLNILFINNYLFFNKNKNVIYINIKRSLMIIFSAIFIFVFILTLLYFMISCKKIIAGDFLLHSHCPFLYIREFLSFRLLWIPDR